MKPEQVIQQLNRGNYDPVYFLQGDEPYFIDQISDYIQENGLEESAKGFNLMVMYGKDSTISDILNNARRYPMMSQRQLVIVKEAQEVTDFGRSDGQKLLLDYIEHPLDSTILVFCYKNRTLDKRKALSKAIAKNCTLVDCKKLYDNKIPGWITSHVKSLGHAINPPTAQLLADFSGNNLERLSREIHKIIINLKQGAEIDASAVQKYVGISKDYNVFELQRALTRKDFYKAQQIAQYFGANPRQNPLIPVIAVLFTFFTKILLIHESKSQNPGDLLSKLRIQPFFLQEYQQAARNYSRGKVISNLGFLRAADLQVKGITSSNAQPGEILKELIYKLVY